MSFFVVKKYLLTTKHIKKVNNNPNISQIYPSDIPISVNNLINFVYDSVRYRTSISALVIKNMHFIMCKNCILLTVIGYK